METEKRSKKKSKSSKLAFKKVSWKAGIFLLVFWGAICPILNWISKFSDLPFFRWFVLKESVSDWFAFWGSFSGTIATVLVGLVTINLTETIERENKKDAKLKRQLAIVEKMPDIVCSSAMLYYYDEDRVSKEILKCFLDNVRNYTLHLKLKPAFPSYFMIKINRIEFHDMRSEKLYAMKDLVDGTDYKLLNHEDCEVLINIDDKAYDILEHFYNSNLEMTAANPDNNRHRKLTLGMVFENTLFRQNEATIQFDLVIFFENSGCTKEGVRLKPYNLQYNRM